MDLFASTSIIAELFEQRMYPLTDGVEAAMRALAA